MTKQQLKSDIRWIQRYDNYKKAFNLLKDAIKLKKISDIERAGLIQFFEMTFELAWKLLKDYLEAEGYTIKSPRDAIKTAYQSGIISQGHTWIDALKDRNMTVHTYEKKIAVEVEEKIKNDYYQILSDLNYYFDQMIIKNNKNIEYE